LTTCDNFLSKVDATMVDFLLLSWIILDAKCIPTTIILCFITSYCLLSFKPVPSEMTDISETSIFDSINDAKAAVTHLATLQKRPVVVVNSRPTQFRIKCKDSSCSFEVSCFQRKDGKMHISKFVKDLEQQQFLCRMSLAD
jgi:hypothetical protein